MKFVPVRRCKKLAIFLLLGCAWLQHASAQGVSEDVKMMRTPRGMTFSIMSPHAGAAPTLLLLASTGETTLRTDPYRRIGAVLHAQGWNVESLDLPCHGADRKAAEPEGLAGWAARIRKGENFVPLFQERVNDVLGWQGRPR